MGEKLSPRFVGPFEILERKGTVAYRLTLPPYLAHMHDMFHIYVLHHYISDPLHVIDYGHLQVSVKGTVMAELVHTLEQQTSQIR